MFSDFISFFASPSYATVTYYILIPLLMPGNTFKADDWLFHHALLGVLFHLFNAFLTDIVLPQLTEIITRQVECIITAFRNLSKNHQYKTY